MIVVVTGGSGLIGGCLLEALAAQDHRVWAISRRPAPSPRPSIAWVQGDLTELSLPTGLPHRADAVFHLAQSDRFRDFPAGALDVFGVNVASTVRLLEWSRAAGVRHFIYASSGRVDGIRGYYQASKRSAELLAQNYEPFFNVITLRFFFVYGPGQPSTMLIPRLIESVHSGRPIVLDGPDGIRLNPVHVTDAVRAAIRAGEFEGSRTFDIAGPEVLSIREIAAIIGDRIGRRPVFAAGGHDSNIGRALVGDIRDMSRWLAVPTIGFVDGVEPLCRDARRRQPQAN
jgi:UDP-glucose 4-epimerase